MRTPICDRLGIELPIFAFSHCRDVVAAVTKAGGYGVLGALAYSPDQLEIELSWIDDHVDGMPYGVDFAMPVKYVGKGGGEDPRHDLGLLDVAAHRQRDVDPSVGVTQDGDGEVQGQFHRARTLHLLAELQLV